MLATRKAASLSARASFSSLPLRRGNDKLRAPRCDNIRVGMKAQRANNTATERKLTEKYLQKSCFTDQRVVGIITHGFSDLLYVTMSDKKKSASEINVFALLQQNEFF
jgi:hypothetical protein